MLKNGQKRILGLTKIWIMTETAKVIHTKLVEEEGYDPIMILKHIIRK